MLDTDTQIGRTMLAIQRLCGLYGHVSVAYSPYTKKFYVEAPGISSTNGTFETGVVEHRDTPEKAVVAFWEALRSFPLGGTNFVRITRGETVLGAQWDDELQMFVLFTFEEIRRLVS